MAQVVRLLVVGLLDRHVDMALPNNEQPHNLMTWVSVVGGSAVALTSAALAVPPVPCDTTKGACWTPALQTRWQYQLESNAANYNSIKKAASFNLYDRPWKRCR